MSRQSWRGSIRATIGHHPARKYLLPVRGREREGERENIVPQCAHFFDVVFVVLLSYSSFSPFPPIAFIRLSLRYPKEYFGVL